MAQTPAPKPSPAPAALSDSLPIPPAPEPKQSNSWVLLDAANGQVLAGENVDERVAPASITQVMTSYVLAAEMKAGKIGRDDQVMMTERSEEYTSERQSLMRTSNHVFCLKKQKPYPPIR